MNVTETSSFKGFGAYPYQKSFRELISSVELLPVSLYRDPVISQP